MVPSSEITEEKDEEDNYLFINTEAQRERIRQIIEYQKSLYWSSSSSSSLSTSAASCSSFSSSRRNSNLLDLMKVGSMSLKRLFEMEHTTLATHFQDYTGSPLIKTIPLWGSDDTDNDIFDPWSAIKKIGTSNELESDSATKFASDASFRDGDFHVVNNRRKLRRKSSFRRLPRLSFHRFMCFRFRLRWRRIRIKICGKIF